MNTKRTTFFRFVFVTLTMLTTTFCSVLWAQNCSPINLHLTTQADVDNFQLNHGPCDQMGSLWVEGADITNLDGLSGLTSVTYLNITDNPMLTSLVGHSSLTYVSGLTIAGNTSLTNVDGFMGITSLSGGLGIRDNTALTNISGLSALTSAWSIGISNNPLLANVAGFSALTNVGNNLLIWGNASLTTLDGLSALYRVGAESKSDSLPGVSIIDNAVLDNLDGLSTLTSLQGELWIQDNAALSNINGLSYVTGVNSLTIKNNALLTNLNGLSGLNGVIKFLGIISNPKLSNMDGLSGLNGVNGWLVIQSNPKLSNLDGLSSLTRVDGGLQIVGNASLSNINGLSALFSVGLDLEIRGNTSLINMDGLSALTSVGEKLFIEFNTALTNVDGLSSLSGVGLDLYVQTNELLSQCAGLARLIDQWDDAEPGPGPGPEGGTYAAPDLGRYIFIMQNLTGCNSVQEIMATVNPSKINPGLNDAWYNPETSGQGFFITVFPDLGYVSLAWFTYDTELPPVDATANLGDPGHRWLTAVGPIEGNQVLMDIEMTSGGIFDSASEIIRTDPPGSDGTILLTFTSCWSGTVEYDIPSINKQGIIPIQRVANDNIALCEALNSD